MNVVLIAIACGLLAVLYGFVTSRQVLAASPGNQRMIEIAEAIQEGAKAYLARQYTTIAIVGVIVAVLVFVFLGAISAGGFVIGALLSGAAGFIGNEHLGPRQRPHRAEAARTSLQSGLTVAFRAGAIHRHAGRPASPLLAISIFFYVLVANLGYAPNDRVVVNALVALAFGASLISIFARLGRAASSPRPPMSAPIWSARSRPAFRRTIPATRRRSADNVGDNVGDCAGNGRRSVRNLCRHRRRDDGADRFAGARFRRGHPRADVAAFDHRRRLHHHLDHRHLFRPPRPPSSRSWARLYKGFWTTAILSVPAIFYVMLQTLGDMNAVIAGAREAAGLDVEAQVATTAITDGFTGMDLFWCSLVGLAVTGCWSGSPNIIPAPIIAR